MARWQPCRLAASDRRIAVALLVSLLLHTPLLLTPGVFSLGLSSTSSAPAELQIELQGMPHTVTRLFNDMREPIGASEGDDLAEAFEEVTSETAEAAPQSAAVHETPDETLPEAPEHVVPEVAELLQPSDVMLADTQHEEVIGDEASPDDSERTLNTAVEIPPAVETELAAAVADEAVITIAPEETRRLKRLLEDEARDLLASNATHRELEFETRQGRYSARLTRQRAAGGMGVERVAVDLVAGQGSERVRTQLQLKRLAFSHFTQLIDRWDSQVQLHDDEIAGRFHSNSVIKLTYDHQVAPRLLGLVTTARYVDINDEKGYRPRSKIFVGGLKTNTPRIRLPQVALPVNSSAVDGGDVHMLPGDTLIVFRADGTYRATDLSSGSTSTRSIPDDKPLYIMGSSAPELQVLGVVKGRVTVYSPRNIVINGSLTYATDPRSEDAEDYLGLVADRNVEIAKADVTGPGDLHVHAAIYARNRFVIRNTSARRGGTLFVYGSITAGSMSESEPRYGTRTEFDPRFERVRPPGFPETDRYEVEDWNERWHLAENGPIANP